MEDPTTSPCDTIAIGTCPACGGVAQLIAVLCQPAPEGVPTFDHQNGPYWVRHLRRPLHHELQALGIPARREGGVMMLPLPQLRAIAPELDCRVIPIAEEQEEYLTIYAGLVRNPAYPAPKGWNTTLLAFRLDDEQRAAIAAGADVYVSLLTFGGPMQPIMVQVGKESASAAYNVRAAPGKP